MTSSVFPSIVVRHRREVFAFWAAVAVINLAAGLVIATWPERQADLESMHRWSRAWIAGTNIYALQNEAPDYPPHAILTFSVVGLLGERWLVPSWAFLNLCLAPLAIWLAVRSVRPSATLADSALPIVMFLCWGGFRTLLQFTLVVLALSLLAMALAEKRPVWAGICFGLALAKPQIAAPFLLWALFTGRIRPLVIGVAVVAVEFAVYCARASAYPGDVVAGYSAIVRNIYTGDALVTGLSQLRPLVAAAFANVSIVDAISAVLALLLLAVVCAAAFIERKRGLDVRYSAPSLAVLWSLLTFYYLTYGFVLLLPLAARLLFDDDSPSLDARRRLFWILQAALMVDVPGVWRRLPQSDVLSGTIAHFDRLLMLVLFVGVLSLVSRRDSTAAVTRARRETGRGAPAGA